MFASVCVRVCVCVGGGGYQMGVNSLGSIVGPDDKTPPRLMVHCGNFIPLVFCVFCNHFFFSIKTALRLTALFGFHPALYAKHPHSALSLRRQSSLGCLWRTTSLSAEVVVCVCVHVICTVNLP